MTLVQTAVQAAMPGAPTLIGSGTLGEKFRAASAETRLHLPKLLDFEVLARLEGGKVQLFGQRDRMNSAIARETGVMVRGIGVTGIRLDLRCLFPVVVILICIASFTSVAMPRVQALPAPDTEPLDPNIFESAALPPESVLGDRISPTGLTEPSLWWIREQFTAKNTLTGLTPKLIVNWIAYPHQDEHPGRIDLMVNRQFWSLLDYLQRYAFINEFGAAAREYGYNLRVFDHLANLVGAYTCEFSALDLSQTETAAALAGTAAIPCDLTLDSSGKAGFRGRGKDAANTP